MIKSLTTGEVNVNSLGTFSALGLDFSGGLGLSLGDSFDPAWAYEDGAVGTGQGDDWEDAVDKEIENEDEPMDEVKEEAASPGLFSPVPSPKPKRRLVKKTRTVVIQRKPKVKDLFPAFDPNGACDFTELFRGRVPAKPRVNKARMFRCKLTFILQIYIVTMTEHGLAEVVQATNRPRTANIQIIAEFKAGVDLIQSVDFQKPNMEDSLRKALSVSLFFYYCTSFQSRDTRQMLGVCLPRSMSGVTTQLSLTTGKIKSFTIGIRMFLHFPFTFT